MKLTQFWQLLMLRLALISAVLAVCVLWGGLVAPVSAETTMIARIIHASHATRSVNVSVGTTESAPIVSLSPTSLSFGNHQVNTTSSAHTVTLTNSGNATLTIHSIGLSGPNSGDFHQHNTCPSGSSTLAVGASCFINVTFTPKAEGNLSASLAITDNASGSPHSVALSGSGTTASAPVVSLSPTSLSFGNHQINTTSSARTVTLTNSGNVALTIHSIGLSGPNGSDFHEQNTCPSGSSTLAAGASCTINVTFTPTAEGNFSASLAITDNASGSPQSVILSGTGVLGMPPTGSDPNAQPLVENILQEPLSWLALILAVVAAVAIGMELMPGSLRRRSR
ncbi:MAG: choice-of-anchor D domain-containing protein [Ktedonobacteraceae bacterium]